MPFLTDGQEFMIDSGTTTGDHTIKRVVCTGTGSAQLQSKAGNEDQGTEFVNVANGSVAAGQEFAFHAENGEVFKFVFTGTPNVWVTHRGVELLT